MGHLGEIDPRGHTCDSLLSSGFSAFPLTSVLLLLLVPVFHVCCCDKTLEGVERGKIYFGSWFERDFNSQWPGRRGRTILSARERRAVGLHIRKQRELAQSQRQVQPSKPAPGDLLLSSRAHL